QPASAAVTPSILYPHQASVTQQHTATSTQRPDTHQILRRPITLHSGIPCKMRNRIDSSRIECARIPYCNMEFFEWPVITTDNTIFLTQITRPQSLFILRRLLIQPILHLRWNLPIPSSLITRLAIPSPISLSRR